MRRKAPECGQPPEKSSDIVKTPDGETQAFLCAFLSRYGRLPKLLHQKRQSADAVRKGG